MIRFARLIAVALLMPAVARAETCAGRDILSELGSTDTAVHAAILAEAARTPNSDAVLWKVEKEGVLPSHLLGTIHLTDARVTTLTPAADAILNEARVLALEVADLGPEATAKAMAAAGPIGLFTDGQRLDKLLDATDFKRVAALLAEARMPADRAAMFRPWLITLVLSTSACERRQVQKGVKVLDASLAVRARQANIPVVGLETMGGQLSSMAGLPENEQVGMLRAAIAYADRRDDLMESLVQLYLKREIATAWPLQIALAKRAGIDASAFDGFHREVIVARNRRMRDAALPLLNEGRALIAVGALHLVGEEGLVALLRERGYAVSPIN